MGIYYQSCTKPDALKAEKFTVEKGERLHSLKVHILKDVVLGGFSVLSLAFAFIEFSSTVMVADSNKVTHSIKCAIYGNISLVQKKKIKSRMIAKSKGPNISAMFAALLLLTEVYGKITC